MYGGGQPPSGYPPYQGYPPPDLSAGGWSSNPNPNPNANSAPNPDPNAAYAPPPPDPYQSATGMPNSFFMPMGGPGPSSNHYLQQQHQGPPGPPMPQYHPSSSPHLGAGGGGGGAQFPHPGSIFGGSASQGFTPGGGGGSSATPDVSGDGASGGGSVGKGDGGAGVPTGASGSASAASKKKRRKTVVEVDSAGSPPADDSKEKRVKTGRACDACRSKKIRCDILPSAEVNGEEQPICAHCKQYNLECTFFLPITETRFKKRKQADEADPGISTSLLGGSGTSPTSPIASAEVPGRFEGPSSINFLLHTTLPAEAGQAYDLRHHHSWEVSEDGNGLIRINAPPSAAGFADGRSSSDDPSGTHNRLNKPLLSAQTISLLVNAYFEHLAPLFPVISRSDFAAKQNPSPLLLYSICGLGATRREFPRQVFAGIRGVINGLIRSNDVLSDARFENVQALLLLAQAGDLHAQPTAATASASLIRMGIATRMAQDLGLHRESNLRAQTTQDLAYVELRRRVWATCVILDRWYGAALGIPLLVDLLDCDVLLPAPYEIVDDAEPSTWPVDHSFTALTEHLKLSILVGRVLKTIYSPSGLKHANDAQLEGLLRDMTSWHENLPDQLKFTGNDSNDMAGLLHLSYAALHFLFWRVFMRITYTCPAHLTFGLEVNSWSRMVDWSRAGLEWLSHHDYVLDTLFVFPYAATSCSLVQYHTWARRNDPAALETLKLVRDTAVRWEQSVQPDQMSIRRKTCETMTLLYEAALKTNPEEHLPKDRPAPINPTPGVAYRNDFGKAVFIKDADREGGGIWVARDELEKLESGLRDSSIVLASDLLSKTAPEGPGPRQADLVGSALSNSDFHQAEPAVRNRAEIEPGVTGLKTNEAQLGDTAVRGRLDQDLLGPGPGPGSGPNGDQDHGLAAPMGGDEGKGGDANGVPGQNGEEGGVGAGQGQGDHQALQGLQMTGSNVNPQMNFGDLFGGGNANGTMAGDMEMVQASGMNFSDPTAFDMTSFEGFPTSGMNFGQWNSWFESIDRLLPAPDQSFSPQQGGPWM